MFLSNMIESDYLPKVEKAVALLPSPLRPLHGKRASPLVIPDNIVCFCRRTAEELNKSQRGRALHHRHVLIVALRTAVTVCVDDRTIRLETGEGLLVLPFQFHDYVDPEAPQVNWLFITFECADSERFQGLRYRPFKVTPELASVVRDTVQAYLTPGGGDMTALLLALLLERVIRSGPARRKNHSGPAGQGLLAEVNRMVLRTGGQPSVKEMAQAVGISTSHLRARFRASCGVSLGRHLRRLRLEKACGLLRLSQHRVSEIAEQCGFTSIYSFSRAFRMAFNVSPLAYRHGDRGKGRKGGAALKEGEKAGGQKTTAPGKA